MHLINRTTTSDTRAPRRLLAKAVLVVAVTAGMTLAGSGAASASVAQSAPAGPTVTIDGQAFPTTPLLAAKGYVIETATGFSLAPGARAHLPKSTITEITTMIALLAADQQKLKTQKPVSVTPGPAPAKPTVRPMINNGCWGNSHWIFYNQNQMDLDLTDCTVNAFLAMGGGVVALASVLFAWIGPLEWAPAIAIAAGYASASAMILGMEGWCDFFGPGGGMRFTWSGYPTVGCW